MSASASSVQADAVQKKERPSFNQWLEIHGVVGKSENDILGREKEAIVNYLFSSSKSAKHFLNVMSLQGEIYLNNQVIYPHSLTNKKAIIITPEMLQNLENIYNEYIQKNYPYSKEEIQDYIALIQARIDAHSSKLVESDYKKLQLLASNQDESGWAALDALVSYNESIVNYKVLFQDQINQGEADSLDYCKFVNDCIIQHEKSRGDKKTPKELQEESEELAQQAIELLSKDASVILRTGKYASHAAYILIQKKSPDYFYTEFNAGAGSPVVAASDKEKILGIHLVSCTRKIKPRKGESLEEAVGHIVKAENESLYYQNNKETQKEGQARILACNKACKKRLSKEIVEGVKGFPQRSENCTIMSLKLLSDTVAPMLSEDHFRFMKSCDDQLQLLHKKKIELQSQLKRLNELARQLTPLPDHDDKVLRSQQLIHTMPGGKFFNKPPLGTPLKDAQLSVLHKDKIIGSWEKPVLDNPAKKKLS
jgi:hypothetical protein